MNEGTQKGLYFSAPNTKPENQTPSYQPLSVSKAAIEGTAREKEAMLLLSSKQSYLRLSYLNVLLIASHYPKIARIVLSPDLSALLREDDIGILAMNHDLIKQEYCQHFHVTPESVGVFKEKFEQARLSTLPTKPKNFTSMGEDLMWQAIKREARAKEILKTPYLNEHLKLNHLCQIANVHEFLAQRLITEKAYCKKLNSDQLLKLSFNHPGIVAQICQRKDLWKKMDPYAKLNLALAHEQAAHKILQDKTALDEFVAEMFYRIADSSLSVAQRMITTDKFRQRMTPDLAEVVQKQLTFCERLSLKLQLALSKEEHREHPKRKAMP